MNSDNINQLLDALKSDSTLKARLSAATSVEEAVAIATAAGIEISAADLLAARRIQMPELSDAELEVVSGGADTDKASCRGTCGTDKRESCC
jgi:predicted ribosomally synthesized peptide with nif11-like leader